MVVAYNHVNSLARVLDRIPESIWERVAEVVVLDDASDDETFLVGRGYQVDRSVHKLTIIRNEENLGYGGNQKKGYRYCVDKGYDIAVLLHGDGQYAPEVMWDLIEPVDRGQADLVMGSRMLKKGEARGGGMPLYKLLGKKVLTFVENMLLGSELSEFHSGYRVYNLHALERIPFERCTNDFHFDTEVIVQLWEAGSRIEEKPIPTYYGDEISYVNSINYGRNVIATVAKYWLWRRGILELDNISYEPRKKLYSEKSGRFSSHRLIADLCPRGLALDIGCGEQGVIGGHLIQRGCRVVGVDIGARAPEGFDAYYSYDLNRGLPDDIDLSAFDSIILADVLEHLVDPERLVIELHERVSPRAAVIGSTGNVANFYVRFALLFGYFPYARKGILDSTHLRFYTVGSFKKLWRRNGFDVESSKYTVFPFENLLPGWLSVPISWLYKVLMAVLPGLFAYQTIVVARRTGSAGLTATDT